MALGRFNSVHADDGRRIQVRLKITHFSANKRNNDLESVLAA